MTVKGACEGDMRVMELFCVLIVMVVAEICACVKIHRTLHQKKKIHFTV